MQHVIGIALLAAVYYLTRKGVAIKMRGGTEQVLQDLRTSQSTDVYSAVHLSYSKTDWYKFGLRDYKRKALQSLVVAGVVGKTESDKYYLIMDPACGKGVDAE